MTEIDIPFTRDTKNFWVFELKNGIYIITTYMPKSEYVEKPNKITVTVE